MSDRIRLDDLTDDQLADRYQGAEAAVARVRAELHALNSETRLNPAAMAGRRDAVARVRAALDGPHTT
ncbi:hypothetical protein ACFVWY_08775 [Streptomyces sp. NPDC058195]|uniref:hypothetical protein n=1 Tax=Streptomyces sp. NPDC058195 TaxID=3346375 RepID=UPI0036EBD83F